MRGHRWLLAGLAALALAAHAESLPAGADTAPAVGPGALPGAPPHPAALRARLARALEARGEGYAPRTKHRRPDGSPMYTNRLLLERSPYLQQHAHNPVDWHPWGDEAFETAARLKRPVLVSIGYSTCHWCHVMEDESYDDPEVAAILNAHFVAIKVDREARPDVDAVYMKGLEAMGQGGGWPLNVWLTPDRKPFFGGTYFPPEDRDGRPGFRTVLASIRDLYSAEPERVAGVAERLAEAIRAELEGSVANASLAADSAPLHRAARAYVGAWDREWGGVGGSPRFPATFPVRLLLRYHRRSGDAEVLHAVTHTLERMADGGIYDHVGGGFHRYATDRRWRVPHFEKMLYDNALLALAYLEASVVTGRDDFADVTRDVLGYLEREMTSPEGGFYSATDADSRTPAGEMEEGWFFTWTPAEIEAALGAEDAAAVVAAYGVSAAGNFEGRNILHRPRPLAAVAAERGVTEAALRTQLAAARERLRAARARREPPLRDDKILAGWNGLAISAFAQAGLVLGNAGFVRAAGRAADFVLRSMRREGRLVRVFLHERAADPAFLEDYAFLIGGLLDLYEAAPDPRWLREALALQAVLDAHYADTEGGGYFRTADDQERLIAREKPLTDGAIPSGNSAAALNLLRLGELTGEERFTQRATLLLSAFHETLATRPTSVSELLLALDYQLDAVKEVILVSPASGSGDGALLEAFRRRYVPNRILALVREGPELEAHAAVVPLVAGKKARGGRATAYVCENRVCRFPTSDPAEFGRQLEAVRGLE